MDPQKVRLILGIVWALVALVFLALAFRAFQTYPDLYLGKNLAPPSQTGSPSPPPVGYEVLRAQWWSTFVALTIGILAIMATLGATRIGSVPDFKTPAGFFLGSLFFAVFKFFQWTHPDYSRCRLLASLYTSPLAEILGLLAIAPFIIGFVILLRNWWTVLP